MVVIDTLTVGVSAPPGFDGIDVAVARLDVKLGGRAVSVSRISMVSVRVAVSVNVAVILAVREAV